MNLIKQETSGPGVFGVYLYEGHGHSRFLFTVPAKDQPDALQKAMRLFRNCTDKDAIWCGKWEGPQWTR